MELNIDSYFSKEANKEYISVSQFKSFVECEAQALHNIEIGGENEKQAFLEGKLFENWVAGDRALFMAQHPEMVSTRGATAGQLKAEFNKVIKAAERFLEQDFFKDIINKCEKQVILTGEIEGVKVKCALDLFDRETNSIYDIKCMKDFKEQWSKEEKSYVPWYYIYGYVLQLAVYREIVRQNFGEPKEIGLMAASKEEEPDLQAKSFSSELLDLELEYFKNNVKRYNDIKKGIVAPTYCGECSYCKSIKQITRFEVIK